MKGTRISSKFGDAAVWSFGPCSFAAAVRGESKVRRVLSHNNTIKWYVKGQRYPSRRARATCALGVQRVNQS